MSLKSKITVAFEKQKFSKISREFLMDRAISSPQKENIKTVMEVKEANSLLACILKAIIINDGDCDKESMVNTYRYIVVGYCIVQ